ncbi:MAG: hypothetical protein RLZZ362_646 [Actinomycetota bacterium]
MTVEQTLRPPSANPLEGVATAILGAVEQQLSRYFTAMNQRMDALQQGVDQQRQAAEQRFTDLSTQQHRRFLELEQYVQQRFDQVEGATGIDAETMLEIRQTVRTDMERSFGEVRHRLDELVAADRRLDEQGASLGLRMINTAEALAQRIEQGDQQAAKTIDGHLSAMHRDLTLTIEGLAAQLHDRTITIQSKVDASESRGVDRSLALEGRIKEEQGRKIAELDAVLGRTTSGFDEAIIAVSRRVIDVENAMHDTDARLAEIAARVGTLDESVLDEFRQRVDHAVGEATLVRIEIDRLITSTQEHLDHSSVRLSQIEELVSDSVDVSAAVQLERLDELERQVLLLAPYIPPASPASSSNAAAGDTGSAYDSYESTEADSTFSTH